MASPSRLVNARSRALAAGMAKTPKPLDEVDWAEAAEHLVGMFPGASLGQVVARAEAADRDSG